MTTSSSTSTASNSSADPSSDTPSWPKSWDEAQEVMAVALPGYQPRAPQVRGAHAVEAALDSGRHLFVEAGTGLGKSMLTLIPAVTSGKRVVISTATKALQRQLTGKDLPWISENIRPVSWALLQGRSNYFCAQRALAALGAPGQTQGALISRLLERSNREVPDGPFNGLRSDFDEVVPDEVWSEVCGHVEECRELRCAASSGCWAADARDAALKADVLVVNHSLLAISCQLQAWEYDMFGARDAIIVDEAHELVSAVASTLGSELTSASVTSLCSQVRRFVESAYADNRMGQQVIDAAGELTGRSQLLFLALSQLLPDGSSALRLTPSVIVSVESELEGIISSAQLLAQTFDRLGPVDGDAKADNRRRILGSRCVRLAERLLHTVASADVTASAPIPTVSWVAFQPARRGGDPIVALSSRPLDVSEFLSGTLLNLPVIAVSATLRAAGAADEGFAYIASQWGLVSEDYDRLNLGTVFDYATQSRMFVPPEGFPEPAGKSRQAWESVVPGVIVQAIQASRGRALVLFTSIAAMNRAFQAVEPEVDFPCRKQGDAPTEELAAWFAADIHSVLFATRSFMTGVDFPGETCSLVILDKLVFASPADPVEEAMGLLLQSRGRNPFFDRSVPEMSLVLAQAAGRLIRSTSDRGVFMLLDPRITTKAYGGKVLKALPPMPRIRTIEDVASFLAP